MTSFSEAQFLKKLTELNGSQQSIQTLSLWLIHHRKRSRVIVDVWAREIKRTRPNKKLVFLYLANDVVQNSRKRGTDFIKAFHSVMHDAFRSTAKDVDQKTKDSMSRIVKVWADRKIFSDLLIQKLSQSLVKQKSEHKKKKKKELSLLEEVEGELAGETQGEPPETEDLVKSLEELANSASSDAAVRECIAALPAEVSDLALLQKLSDRRSAEKLAVKAEEAKILLENYNKRLGEELDDRRQTAKMLRQFIQSQKDALSGSERNLQEYRSKLSHVAGMRKEIKIHLQSLPDLTLLPDVAAGLAPLPSTGDLFS